MATLVAEEAAKARGSCQMQTSGGDMTTSDTLQETPTASKKRAAVTSKATDGIRRHDLDTHTLGYGGRRCASSARRQEGGTENDP